MKILVLILLSGFTSAAQNKFSFKFLNRIESASLLLKENYISSFEGTETEWKPAKQKWKTKVEVQYPFAIIHLPPKKNIHTVVIADTILMQCKKEWYLLFPGEYSVKRNRVYNYIICETEFIDANDSIPVQPAHVYSPPW